MKNQKLLKAISILLLSTGAFVLISSCSTNNTKDCPAIEKSKALFDYSHYIGDDDFYNNNPLPEENYFYNPILPGWYSDPSICSDGENYFLVTSTFTYFPGVPIFHSTDLVNWKQIGHILDRPSQLVNMEGQDVSGGIFAPAISYNPHNKTYYMVTTNVGAGNFFVKTKDPFGKWSDPIMLPEVGGIDPSFFFDDDGKAYILNNDEAPDKPEYSGHRTIRIQEFDAQNDKTIGERKILVDKGANPEEKPIWIEGPHMYKINGQYYLMSAEGGTGPHHSEVIFKGDNPWGKFTPWEENPILTQRQLAPERSNPITCAGHADVIQTKEGDWWAVFLACRPINNKFENLGRETFMMPVQWSEDGFPYMTQGNDLIPMIVKKDNVIRSEKNTYGNFEDRDEFDSDNLGLQWLTLRGAAKNLYSLSENSGFLTLNCTDISSTEKSTPAFVARRIQHHKFSYSTRMLFDTSEDNESAGILIFKDETHQYYLAVKNINGRKIVIVEQIGKPSNKILASSSVETNSDEYLLKVVSNGLTFDFYYSTDSKKTENWTLLCKDVDANYLSTATAGGFTGTTIGLYATKK